MLGPAPADPERRQPDQGGEDPGQRATEQHESGERRRRARLPPDQGRGGDGDAAPPPDDPGRRNRPGQHGQDQPACGQGAPEAERGQAGRRRGQAKVPATVARLPLPGGHLEAGVDEEDQHSRRDHEPGPAPGPRIARVPGDCLPRRRLSLLSRLSRLGCCRLGLLSAACRLPVPPGRRPGWLRGGGAGRVLGRPLLPPLPQPQGRYDQIQPGQDQIGRPPGGQQNGRRDQQRPDGRPHPVGGVQQVQQPWPAGQAHRGVQPAVHHPGRQAPQYGDGEQHPQVRSQRVARAGQRRAGGGAGEQDGHTEPADQRADEGADRDGADRGDQQDEPQIGDRRAERLTRGRPGGAEHAIGQAQGDEAAQAEGVQGPPGPAAGPLRRRRVATQGRDGR